MGEALQCNSKNLWIIRGENWEKMGEAGRLVSEIDLNHAMQMVLLQAQRRLVLSLQIPVAITSVILAIVCIENWDDEISQGLFFIIILMIFFQSLSLWIKLNGKQFICRNDVIPLTQPMNSLYNKSTLSTIQVLFLFAQNSNGILDKQEKILYKQDEIFYKLNKILHAKKAPRANKEKCETPIAFTFIFMVMLTHMNILCSRHPMLWFLK